MSDVQGIALALVPKMTGFMSMIGSFWIIVEVLTDSTKKSNVYHRLLMVLSCSDFCFSLFMFAGTWLIPSDTDDNSVAWAIGNEQSCQIQGFAIQLGIISPM